MKLTVNFFKMSMLTILVVSMTQPISAIPKSQQKVVNLKPTSKTCEQAIDLVKQDLLRRGLFSPAQRFTEIFNPTVTTEINFISENFYDYPSQRTETISFILTDEGDGTGYSNFSNSPQLMETLSAEIIAACQKVGLVYFGYFIEGGIPVGYFTDNTVRRFTLGDWVNNCENLKPYFKTVNTSSGGTRELFKWGYYCTV